MLHQSPAALLACSNGRNSAPELLQSHASVPVQGAIWFPEILDHKPYFWCMKTRLCDAPLLAPNRNPRTSLPARLLLASIFALRSCLHGVHSLAVARGGRGNQGWGEKRGRIIHSFC